MSVLDDAKIDEDFDLYFHRKIDYISDKYNVILTDNNAIKQFRIVDIEQDVLILYAYVVNCPKHIIITLDLKGTGTKSTIPSLDSKGICTESKQLRMMIHIMQKYVRTIKLMVQFYMLLDMGSMPLDIAHGITLKSEYHKFIEAMCIGHGKIYRKEIVPDDLIDFFEAYNVLKKSIMLVIREYDIYKNFIMKEHDPKVWEKIKPYEFPMSKKMTPYQPAHDGGLYISFDMVKGNATTLFYFLNYVLDIEFSPYIIHEWDKLVDFVSDEFPRIKKFVIKSKKFRQIILGDLIREDTVAGHKTKRLIESGMKTMTGHILRILIESGSIKKENVISYLKDEIVIRVKNDDIDIAKAEMQTLIEAISTLIELELSWLPRFAKPELFRLSYIKPKPTDKCKPFYVKENIMTGKLSYKYVEAGDYLKAIEIFKNL
jgi:hypothetical protein